MVAHALQLCVSLDITQVLLVALTMALFCSRVLVSYDSVTDSQLVQQQDLETEVPKWNSAIIHLIIYTYDPLPVTCQNVLYHKGQFDIGCT